MLQDNFRWVDYQDYIITDCCVIIALSHIEVPEFDLMRAPYSTTHLHVRRRALHEKWTKSNLDETQYGGCFLSVLHCWLLFEIIIEASSIQKWCWKSWIFTAAELGGKASQEKWASFFSKHSYKVNSICTRILNRNWRQQTKEKSKKCVGWQTMGCIHLTSAGSV